MIARLLPLLAFAGLLHGQALQLDCSQPQILNFTSAANRFNLRFTGQQGEAILIRFVPVAGTISAGFAIDQPLLVDPFNNRVAARTPDDAPPDVIGDPNGRIGYHFDLPGDGDYTVQISSRSNATATIQVSLTRLNRPCSGVTLTCGRSVSGNLPPTAKMDTYQFPARTGDVVSFRMLRAASAGPVDTSTGIYIGVYGPDGKVLNSDSLAAYRLAGRSDVTAKADGNLTLVIWEATASKGGFYYVSAVRLNGGCGGPSLTCNSAVDGQITTPLSLISYNISAAAGDVYQFRVGRTDTAGSFAVAAEVFDAQGKLVGTVNAASPSGHAASSATVRLPNAGAYSVLVSGTNDGSSGTFTLASTRINRPCTDTTISCSARLDDSLAGVVRNRVYALTASAGDTFLLRLLQPDDRNLFSPRADVLDSAGTPLQFVTGGGLSRATFRAPADGTYTLLVSDSYDSGQSGSYSLSVTRLNRPCDAVSLSCGGVVTGNLTRSLDSGVYSWNAAAGESFTVRMLAGASGVQPSTEVYDSTGAAVGTAFTNGSGGVDVVAPAAGLYTVVALDNNRTPSTGSFSVELLRTVNACAAPLAQGQTAAGVVSASAPFAVYTLRGSEGDLLTLRSASSTAGFAAQMELYDPDGRRLDNGVFSLSRRLAASGAYTAILGAAAPRTAGGYAFAWQLMNQPAAASALLCGGSTPGSLAGSTQFRYYSVPANAGDVIRLLFTRVDNFSPQMELFDPSGARVAATSDVSLKAASTGNYLVLVSPSTTAAETGAYTLALQRPNNPCSPTSISCGQSTFKQVVIPGQLDAFAFNAPAGDLHTIRLTPRSGNYTPLAELYNPAGTRLSSSTTGQIRTVIPADGLYTLLVRDSQSVSLGSYRVSVQDDTATCAVDDKEAPVITLLRPTGGEVLPGGTVFHLQWLSDDNTGVAKHDIALSTDGGKSFPSTIASPAGNAQTYDWILPPDIAPSRNAVLRITATDAAGNAQSASSGPLTVIGSGFTPNYTANYTYDALNHLILGALGNGRTVTWTWDAAGNLVQISAQ